MKNQNLLGFGMIAAAIVAGGALVGRAGDVNPPAGPVQGTMHTLEEIYARIGQASDFGTGGRWKARYVPAESGTIAIAVGSGVVHSVLIQPCSCAGTAIYDENSTDPPLSNPIAILANNTGATINLPLDIEFTNGLVFNSPANSSEVTIIYREDDPQP